jgi:Phosphate-selective porin O and P
MVSRLVRTAVAAAIILPPPVSLAQSAGSSVEERLQKLEAEQAAMKQQLEQRDARIRELESQQQPAPASTTPEQKLPPAPPQATIPDGTTEATRTGETDERPLDTSAPLASGPRGFVLGSGEFGEVKLGAYALVRATNQSPGTQSYDDHLGREHVIDTRRDVQLHRVMIHLTGWLFDPKFSYGLTWWTVNDTEQTRIIGALSYKFSDAFKLSAGFGPMPGTRSIMGSHPLWLGHDRVMTDEYFRAGFTQGIWASGNITPELGYQVVVADNISMLGVTAAEDTRALAYGGTLYWMPTTGEFGPQGAYGDFEQHEEIATRFGLSYSLSPEEDRTAQPSANAPDSTQIRVGDSLLLFERDALGDGVTVQTARFNLIAVDAAIKYKGMFLQAEAYYRVLDDFVATEGSLPIPLKSIKDKGFYVQGSFYPIPRKLELYAATSQIYPDKSAGYRHSYEYLVGANWYWSGTRYQRMNLQIIDVTRSPVNSTFGYYTGGMTGTTITLDASINF